MYGLELHERSDWRVTGPRHTSIVLQYNVVYAYCKLVHAMLFGVQLCMTTELTYLMTAYYTPNNGFIAYDASFYKKKIG